MPRYSSSPSPFHTLSFLSPWCVSTGCVAQFMGPSDAEPWAPSKLAKLLDRSETKAVAIAASTTMLKLVERLDCIRQKKDARAAVLDWLSQLPTAELLVLGHTSPALLKFFNATQAHSKA